MECSFSRFYTTNPWVVSSEFYKIICMRRCSSSVIFFLKKRCVINRTSVNETIFLPKIAYIVEILFSFVQEIYERSKFYVRLK